MALVPECLCPGGNLLLDRQVGPCSQGLLDCGGRGAPVAGARVSFLLSSYACPCGGSFGDHRVNVHFDFAVFIFQFF